MKTKWIAILAIVAVLLLTVSVVAWAQETTPTPQAGYGPGMGGQMQHGNGSMLWAGWMHRAMGQDGNGVCDNFIDENNDGVCDLAGTMQGQGMQHGRGMMGQGAMGRGMMGKGMGFVDADEDGVCDHMQAAQESAPSESESDQ